MDRSGNAGAVTAHGSRRERLRLLDQCLGAVEEEAIRGQHVVSPRLAATIGKYAPSIVEGMSIAEAHDAILGVQASSLSDGADKGVRLSAGEARDLCEKIRRGVGDLSLLVWRAHEGRAWVALGYKTWEQFVHHEVGFSRSRSYQLVDQGRIMATLAEAAGVDSPLYVTEFSARRIKPIIAQLAKDVRAAVGSDRTRDPGTVVEEVVKKGTARAVSDRPIRRRSARADVQRLVLAVKCVSELPSPRAMLADLPDEELALLRGLADAAGWLNDFLAQWSARVSDGGGLAMGMPTDPAFTPGAEERVLAYA
jgi:hypothetical protein